MPRYTSLDCLQNAFARFDADEMTRREAREFAQYSLALAEQVKEDLSLDEASSEDLLVEFEASLDADAGEVDAADEYADYPEDPTDPEV